MAEDLTYRPSATEALEGKVGGPLKLQPSGIESEPERVMHDIRRRLTKLEGKLWDNNQQGALESLEKIEAHTKALRTSVEGYFNVEPSSEA